LQNKQREITTADRGDEVNLVLGQGCGRSAAERHGGRGDQVNPTTDYVAANKVKF
jgi:hypothetical protein